MVPEAVSMLQQIALLNHRPVDRYQIGDWPPGLVCESWSSCPKPVIWQDARSARQNPVLKDSAISAWETSHPIDTVPPIMKSTRIDLRKR
jgi:hypothetical protein